MIYALRACTHLRNQKLYIDGGKRYQPSITKLYHYTTRRCLTQLCLGTRNIPLSYKVVIDSGQLRIPLSYNAWGWGLSVEVHGHLSYSKGHSVVHIFKRHFWQSESPWDQLKWALRLRQQWLWSPWNFRPENATSTIERFLIVYGDLPEELHRTNLFQSKSV